MRIIGAMRAALFGNKTVAQVLLFIYQNRKGYANLIARDLHVPLNMVQKQLNRLEKGHILLAHYETRNKIYSWNKALPFYQSLQKLLKEINKTKENHFAFIDHDAADGNSLSLKERIYLAEQLFDQAEFLNPYPAYKPFTQTFDSFKDYEKWRKKQTNPRLF